MSEVISVKENIINRYLEEGLTKSELEEMQVISDKYGSKLHYLKTKLWDKDVPVNHMDTIFEARNSFFIISSGDFKNRKPTLHKLVELYHRVDENVDEFNSLIQTAQDNQSGIEYVIMDKEKMIPVVKKLSPDYFLDCLFNIYLNEGNRDAQMTIDIFREQKQYGCNSFGRIELSADFLPDDIFDRTKELDVFLRNKSFVEVFGHGYSKCNSVCLNGPFII